MSELLSNAITEMEQRDTKTATKTIERKNRTDIIFDFDGFKYAKGQVFDNDYDFFYTFIIQCGERKIEDYLKPKERGETVYYTARFPEQDKKNMLNALKRLINFKIDKVNAKTTQYIVNSVNQQAIDLEIERILYQAKKSA